MAPFERFAVRTRLGKRGGETNGRTKYITSWLHASFKIKKIQTLMSCGRAGGDRSVRNGASDRADGERQ